MLFGVKMAAILFAAAVAFEASAQSARFPTNEAFTRYLGDNPRGFETDWSEGFNGVSHDETHWYLTQRRYLYRTPLSEPLNRDLKKTHYARLREISELEGYDHFGDISVYPTTGAAKYVLVPVDGAPKREARLALFSADERLRFLGSAGFPGQLDENGDGQAGFVAVDPDGRVYSMRNNGLCEKYAASPEDPGRGSCLRAYRPTWSRVGRETFELHVDPEIPLLDEVGKPIFLENLQGGAITPSGRVIYLLNGLTCRTSNRGLHAFDLETGRRLASSRTVEQFKFDYDCEGDLGSSTDVSLLSNQEPEGMTVWDLDVLPNPGGMRGQLHVMLMENEPFDRNSDKLWFKHYTNRIYVDAKRSGGDGSYDSAYGDLSEAAARAWDGSTVVIRGRYDRRARVNPRQPIRIESQPGSR